MKNIFVTMSGGTTQVINATLAGVVQGVRAYMTGTRIYAGFPGILGALEGNYVDVTELSPAELLKLYRTPASGFIGTTRVKILDDDDYGRLGMLFEKLRVGYFLNIGGSGTIKQTKAIYNKLRDQVVVAALPKTVDNDFGDKEFDDVYFTPGFPSCANYWRHKTAVMNFESLGAYSHDNIVIAQTFGRETGFIAGCARLADMDRKLPLVLLLPEDQRSQAEVVDHLRSVVSRHKRAIVVMTEGYQIEDFDKRHDHSGQVMYGSSRNTNAQLLVNELNDRDLAARAFVPGFDQRSDMRFTSTIDLEAAFGVSKCCMKWLARGDGQFFATICRSEDALNGIGFKQVALAEIHDYGRSMPAEWVSTGTYDVTDAYVDYVLPLIGMGQVPVPNAEFDSYFQGPLRAI